MFSFKPFEEEQEDGLFVDIMGKDDPKHKAGVARSDSTPYGPDKKRWIEYETCQFEPVDPRGNVNKKKHGGGRPDWWVVEKDAQWSPPEREKKGKESFPIGTGFGAGKHAKPLVSEKKESSQSDGGSAASGSGHVKPRTQGRPAAGKASGAKKENEPAWLKNRGFDGESPRLDYHGAEALAQRATKPDGEDIPAKYPPERVDFSGVFDTGKRGGADRMAEPPSAAPDGTFGSVDGYKYRDEDFRRRHPDKEPPPYYMDFGDRYVRKFDDLKGNLSSEGRKWVDKTRLLLQQKMEEGLASGHLNELDPDDFESKVFDMHSDAYLEAGIEDLPWSDAERIYNEVDADDKWKVKAIGSP